MLLNKFILPPNLAHILRTMDYRDVGVIFNVNHVSTWTDSQSTFINKNGAPYVKIMADNYHRVLRSKKHADIIWVNLYIYKNVIFTRYYEVSGKYIVDSCRELNSYCRNEPFAYKYKTQQYFENKEEYVGNYINRHSYG